jgi:TANFOR domain-containing protein
MITIYRSSQNNKLKFSNLIRIIILLLFSTIIEGLNGQPTVSIIIQVTPPYPTKIDVYISQPNKIMAILLNTGSQPVDVYVLGSISSEGGIMVYTDPGYRMDPPLTLLPGAPYNLNRFNLEQVFDDKHLLAQGITLREVIYGNGLPEDTYTICLQAFDYTTGVPVSSESPLGCSNPFLVLDLEPPVILYPTDDAMVEPSIPQNVIFSWTRPPGAPHNMQFSLKIVEVLPSDRNINDAFQSATHPVFYETITGVNSAMLGPSEPALTEGKTYACRVTAYDPSGQSVFRNNGESEVVSFKYMKAGKEK